MVMPILEPICAGIMVSLINKYIVNNLDYVWKFLGCKEAVVCQDNTTEESEMQDEAEESIERRESVSAVSSESTTIVSDVQVHCHHY